MAFPRPKRKTYSEDELYVYAVGALARRMRTVAELKRLMRARIEEADSEYGQTLVELVIRRLKDQGYLNDSQYAAYFLRKKRLEKPKDQKEAARVFRQLARAGFGMKTIFTILKKWDVDDDTLTALESETA